MSILRKMVLAVAISAVTSGVMAAENPDEPTEGSSNGTFDVTYNKGSEVRIWGLKDLSFSGDLATEQTDNFDFCTFSNNTDEIIISAGSANGDFSLSGPGNDNIDYTIRVNDKDFVTSGDVWGKDFLPSGSQGYSKYSASQENSSKNDVVCAGEQQLNTLTVVIPAAEGTFTDGAYTDAVTLTIKPI